MLEQVLTQILQYLHSYGLCEDADTRKKVTFDFDPKFVVER